MTGFSGGFFDAFWPSHIIFFFFFFFFIGGGGGGGRLWPFQTGFLLLTPEFSFPADRREQDKKPD